MKVVKIEDIETTEAYFNPKIRKHIVLASGELGNIVSFAQATIPPGEISRAHAHENMGEIFLVRSGTGIMTIDDVPFQLREGICAVVEPHEIHKIENTGDSPLKIIYIEIIIEQKKA